MPAIMVREQPLPYPTPSAADVEFFQEHGYLVVEDGAEPADLAELEAGCEKIVKQRHRFAFDWTWEKGRSREDREFRLVQGSPTRAWPEIANAPFRKWAVEFASTLMGRPIEFWYDQYLCKPPREGARMHWHQDEGYWGRNLDGRGITCWLPLQDVDLENGCMHFIDRGHRDGVLEHRQPPDVQSDLLYCEPDSSRAIACPLRLGGATFHHGKTPHMTPPNRSDRWRLALTQHLRVAGSLGEGDHYPWKVYVNQFTGERVVPPSR